MALKSPSERRTTIFLSCPVRVEHPSWSTNSAAKSLTGPQTGNALSATLGLAMHGLWIWSHGIKPIYSRRRRWIATDRFSPDGRWFSFIENGSNGTRSYIARANEQPVPESAWIPVMDGAVWAWSPDGNLLYVDSWRDGHECIWAQRLRSSTPTAHDSRFRTRSSIRWG